MNEELELINKKQYKTIFFDIFDTIVSRKVQPEYTKKIWANHLVKRLDLPVSMLEVYKKRNEYESKLGELNAKEGHDWEFTYSSLLSKMYKFLKIDKLNIEKKDFFDIATNIEIEVESSVLVPDEKIIELIKQAKKQGKKIYCISDMYLSKKMLKEIFKNLNILDLFDDIYVSCEYLKGKRSGKLYKTVLEDLKLDAKNCLMVGDNEESDYNNAKKIGMEAIRLDRKANYKKYEKFLNEHNENIIHDKFLELTKSPSNNFEHMAFTLFEFTDRLYHYLRRNNYEEVFFLSREGEFLKKLFDDYQKTIYGRKVKTHYFLVSRKSTYLLSLKKLKNENFDGLLRQYYHTSIKDFLSSLNLSKDEIMEILTSFTEDCKKFLKKAQKLNKHLRNDLNSIANADYDYTISCLYESKIITLLKKNKVFQTIYERNREEQNRLFKRYVEQFTKNKRICVVDIGWHGSIQNNIQNALGKDYEVNGCLYGLVSREEEEITDKVGLIFSNVPERSKNYNLFIENRTIFEVLLGASHGSAARYIENNKKVEVKLFEKAEEKEIYDNIVSKVQDKMFKIHTELVKLFANNFYDNIKVEKEINNLHFDMVFNPSKEQLEFFNGIYHYENFGVFEFSEFNLKKKLNLKYYLKENLKFFLKYKSFFYDTFWPTLKLNNEKLFIQRFIYKNVKKMRLKNKGVL